MEAMPYSHLTRGTFLIATPEIDAGMFFRGVLLLCEHGAAGSFALVVNKALDVELPYEALNVQEFRNPHVQLRASGPVQTNQMMLLHTSNEIPDQTIELCEGVFLGGDLEFLQAAVQREDGSHMLLCFGYSGWGAGQLEREFLDGNWYLCPASREHLFETPPEKLWQVLLKQMGGKYATLSMIPEDLSLN